MFVVWVHTKTSRKALDNITVALVALHSSCVHCKYYSNVEHVTGYWLELIHLMLVRSADISLYCNNTLYLLLVAYTIEVCLTGMTVPLPLPILKLCHAAMLLKLYTIIRYKKFFKCSYNNFIAATH